MQQIKLTETEKQDILEQVKKYLDQHTTDTTISFKLNRPKPDVDTPKATVLLTTKAYAKIQMLVATTDIEISWNGTVTRNGNMYLIDDIILHPQEITQTTVNTDQEKYQNWFVELPDEIAERIRFQGHSHVNMSVGPSGVDEAYYADILSTLPKDDYYIFAIFNKRHEMTWYIYDLRANIFYTTEDINVRVIDEDGNDIYAPLMQEKTEKCTRTATRTYTNPKSDYWYLKEDYNKPAKTPSINTDAYEYDYDLYDYLEKYNKPSRRKK